MNKQTKKCAGKETFQRMNYLYQASNFLASTECPAKNLSDMYNNLLVNISKKAVQRMDIDLKRTICKGCRCFLLAGVSSRVRIKKKQVIWTCKNCSRKRTYNIKDKEYIPWTQRDESIVEILDFHASKNANDTKGSELTVAKEIK